MRHVWGLFGVVVVAATFIAPGIAQETSKCGVYVDYSWIDAPATSLKECLSRLDAVFISREKQDHVFGSWNTLYIAADGKYFYQSTDEGKNWTRLYPKSRLVAAPESAPDAKPAPQPKGTPGAAESAEQAAPQTPTDEGAAAEPSFREKWDKFMSRRWFASGQGQTDNDETSLCEEAGTNDSGC